MSSELLLGAIRAIPLWGRAVWPLVLPVTRQHGARARQERGRRGGRMGAEALFPLLELLKGKMVCDDAASEPSAH